MRQELEKVMRAEIPLAAAMGALVDEASGEGVRLNFPLAPNHNHLRSGFGGSLYSAAVLSGWGLLWCAAQERGVEVQVVIAHGAERFMAPVSADFRAECTADALALDKAFRTLARRGRAGLELDCVVFCGLEACMAFRGTFGLMGVKAHRPI